MKCECVRVSQCIVRLISQQPPAETLFFISISNGSEGKPFKWHANCCNGLFPCTSSAPAPLLQPLYSPFTLYYNDLLPSLSFFLLFCMHTWAQIWEWQFNKKCFSIKQTKGENASINTHLQTTRISRWLGFYIFASNVLQQKLMYRHINQASQVTNAVIPPIHITVMNESLLHSLSLSFKHSWQLVSVLLLSFHLVAHRFIHVHCVKVDGKDAKSERHWRHIPVN